jgi:hypothetical protein
VCAAAAVTTFPLTPTRSVAADLATPTADYAVFSAPAGSSETMPANLLAQQTAGAEIRQQPTTVPGMLAWAVAGDGQLCIAESTSGGAGSQACAPAATLTATGDLLYTATAQGTASTDSDQVDLLAGLAPDGVSSVTVSFADAPTVQVPVSDNGFQLQTAQLVTITSLSWEDAHGVSETQAVGAP